MPQNIVSPQANKPVMGIVQDSLLGCRLFTKRDTFLEKDILMNVLMWLEDWDGRSESGGASWGQSAAGCERAATLRAFPPTPAPCPNTPHPTVPMPAILKPRPLWTGKQVFSMFLPRVNLERRAAWYKDGEPTDMSPVDAQARAPSGRRLDAHGRAACVARAEGARLVEAAHARAAHRLLPAPPPLHAPMQVVIQDGTVLAGTLCKKTLGAAAGGLVHVIWMEHGACVRAWGRAAAAGRQHARGGVGARACCTRVAGDALRPSRAPSFPSRAPRRPRGSSRLFVPGAVHGE